MLLKLPEPLLSKLPYPFHHVFVGECVGEITKVRFVIINGRLDMVRMCGIGSQTGRTERCGVRGINFHEKDVPAIREFYKFLKEHKIPTEIKKFA